MKGACGVVIVGSLHSPNSRSMFGWPHMSCGSITSLYALALAPSVTIGSPGTCPKLSGALTVRNWFPTALIATASEFGATPIVMFAPSENLLLSETGTSVEPFDAPGAATVADAEPEAGATGMTIQ